MILSNLLVPNPIRCDRCQKFGHNHPTWREHEYNECPVDKTEAKCCNCGGNHSAAYKGCTKYKTISSALNLSVKQGISYRDALMQTTSKQTTAVTESHEDTLRHPVQSSSTVPMQEHNKDNIPAVTRNNCICSINSQQQSASTANLNPDAQVDHIKGLIITTATALLWVIKNMPATAGQQEIIQQLNAITLSSPDIEENAQQHSTYISGIAVPNNDNDSHMNQLGLQCPTVAH